MLDLLASRMSIDPVELRQRNLIPAAESEYLANGLRGRVPVRLLLTGLVSHAAVERTPSATQVMELAGFWGDLLTR